MPNKNANEEQNSDNIQLALDLVTRDTEVKPKARVKVGNEIINAKYNLKNKQVKLWFAIISQIREEDENFCVYRFKAKDLATAIGIAPNRGYFKEIRTYLNQLRKRDITLQTRFDENEEKEKLKAKEEIKETTKKKKIQETKHTQPKKKSRKKERSK